MANFIAAGRASAEELDFYTALLLVQNNLTNNFPDLFGETSAANEAEEVVQLRKQKIRSHIDRFVTSEGIKVSGIPDSRTLCDLLYQDMVEYSVLTDYINDINNEIEEINVNAWNDIEIRYSDGRVEKGPHFCNVDHAQNVLRRIIANSGAQLDDAMPMAEGNIRNNVRVVVLNSPIVDEEVGSAASIRLLKPQFATREFFIKNGTVSESELQFLELAIRTGVSIVFVGATGSGKTTLMNYLLGTIPNERRVVTIEHNARELSLVKTDENGKIINNVVHLLTRPHENGKYNISQEDLVAKALRLDPNVICVGEMRDSEAYAAQEASLTGHTVVTSLHADGVGATHFRVAMLSLKKYMVDINVALLQAAMAFPVIVYLSKLDDNSRRVMEISECSILENSVRVYSPLFEYAIQKNRMENGNLIIEGEHRRASNVSEGLRKTMMLNGATMEELEQISYHPQTAG